MTDVAERPRMRLDEALERHISRLEQRGVELVEEDRARRSAQEDLLVEMAAAAAALEAYRAVRRDPRGYLPAPDPAELAPPTSPVSVALAVAKPIRPSNTNAHQEDLLREATAMARAHPRGLVKLADLAGRLGHLYKNEASARVGAVKCLNRAGWEKVDRGLYRFVGGDSGNGGSA